MANRSVVFADLEAKFIDWLKSQGPNGVFAAAIHYRDNLKAIGNAIQPHATPTGRWDGFYELLTGDRPTVGVFDVKSVAEFSAQYGKAALFFAVEKKANEVKPQIQAHYPNCQYFDDLFQYAHISGDGGHTRKGYVKYCQFLCELESQVDHEINQFIKSDLDESLQKIFYGAPGTGKSYKVDGLTDNQNVAACVRTTFHPDSDYATFVGAYKPVIAGGKIAYEFRPQAFMNAYVRAWQEMAQPDSEGKVKSVVLVIEEINRGNCAQIFGDLFQLLDRGKNGYSTYPIDADTDIATWLAEENQLGNKLAGLAKPDDIKKDSDWADILVGKKLALPSNLYIWATMNTSDQSLFPIDSAFKRRWDWEYVPIAKPDKSDDRNWKERKIEVGDLLFDWWEFLTAINGHIAKATESEDKQLGYFFVKADDATGYISAEQFANKVLFYLYGDVFKSYERPKENCFKDLSFRDFFYSEKTEIEQSDGTKVVKKSGDVKLDVVAGFLKGLKWKEIVVTCEQKPVAAAATTSETVATQGASTSGDDNAAATGGQ